MDTLLTLNPLKLQTHLLKFPNSHSFNRITNQTYFFSPISCKISSQTNKDTTTKNKVVVPGVAPSLSEENGTEKPPKMEELQRKKTGGVVVKRFTKRVLAGLANLPLALGEMFTIAGLMALGM